MYVQKLYFSDFLLIPEGLFEIDEELTEIFKKGSITIVLSINYIRIFFTW